MATWPPFTDDDGSNTTGTVLDNAYFTAIKGYVDAKVSEALAPITGAWVDVPFSAGNFGANGGTWTVGAGNQGRFSYLKNGRTVFLDIVINGATVGGAPSTLNILVPFVVLTQQAGWAYYFGSTSFGHALMEQTASDQFLRFKRDGYGTAFVAETMSFRTSLILQTQA